MDGRAGEAYHRGAAPAGPQGEEARADLNLPDSGEQGGQQHTESGEAERDRGQDHAADSEVEMVLAARHAA